MGVEKKKLILVCVCVSVEWMHQEINQNRSQCMDTSDNSFEMDGPNLRVINAVVRNKVTDKMFNLTIV